MDHHANLLVDLGNYHSDIIHCQTSEWLSPIDPSERHDEIKSARLSGTCEWIRTDVEFQRWVKTTPSDNNHDVICWVGDPGILPEVLSDKPSDGTMIILTEAIIGFIWCAIWARSD